MWAVHGKPERSSDRIMIKGNIRRAFTYLESGSVLLVATNDGTSDNVMTISWQMVMDFTTHIAITTGSWNEAI